MITQAIHIDQFMVKKGELTLQKDTKQSATSNKDKTKYISKNREVVHDGVVDNVTLKPTKEAFNLTDGLNAAKNAKKPPLDKKTSKKKMRNSWATSPKREYTPLG